MCRCRRSQLHDRTSGRVGSDKAVGRAVSNGIDERLGDTTHELSVVAEVGIVEVALVDVVERHRLERRSQRRIREDRQLRPRNRKQRSAGATERCGLASGRGRGNRPGCWSTRRQVGSRPERTTSLSARGTRQFVHVSAMRPWPMAVVDGRRARADLVRVVVIVGERGRERRRRLHEREPAYAPTTVGEVSITEAATEYALCRVY